MMERGKRGKDKNEKQEMCERADIIRRGNNSGMERVMVPFVVLFDMDGLMLDTERMAINAWKLALAERGDELDEITFQSLRGLTVSDTASAIADILGPDWPFHEVFARRQTFYEAEIETSGIPIKPGLMELLSFLEANQVPKAIASSSPCRFASRKLGHTGLGQYFQTVVCGDMAQRGKPAPDLFLEAARQMDFPPAQCIVLEDSDVGIIAAHSAGMLPVMIPDLKQPTPEIRALAFRVLPSLHEVIPLVEDFLRNGLPKNGKAEPDL
jgi:HAD superfamily hydrolase (TIGR01509 family)